MKIIPVIDVLNGIAVHAIRGERKRYRPLRSVLCKSADPLDIALTFESLGFKSLYLADLDSILGKPANFDLYQQIIAETNLELMVDAGIADIIKAKKVLETGATKIIIGSETLNSLDFLNQVAKAFGEDKVVVSIDLKEGKLLSLSEAIKSMDTISFAQKLADIGISQIIVLDLSRVGTEHGINSAILENILEKTSLEVFVGGGITGIQELEELRKLGVSGALIATVLHNGKLKVDELKSNSFLA
ncbi:MAG: HisA/HisF family protein [Candidatus Bathyarchaeum sp.]|nr:MAG: HisA/HisF family protein [Candidatus Bathyarchaeum sp.]